MSSRRLALIYTIMLASACSSCSRDTQAEAAATEQARKAVGDPHAAITELRVAWSPRYQRVVCGHIQVGAEERRFVALLLSDMVTVTGAIVEPASFAEKDAFSEMEWRPMCEAGS